MEGLSQPKKEDHHGTKAQGWSGPVVSLAVSVLLLVVSGIPCPALAGPSSEPNHNTYVTNGGVASVVTTGSTVYIGGEFHAVQGVERNHIAHILSNGTLDPVWNLNANSNVYWIAVSGGTVYAGGLFQRMGLWQQRSPAQFGPGLHVIQPALLILLSDQALPAVRIID